MESSIENGCDNAESCTCPRGEVDSSANTIHEEKRSQSSANDDRKGKGGRMKRFKFFSLHAASPCLKNTGSVARDHLANERTWLAYIRTSLAISGTGIALVQLFTVTALNQSMIVVSAAGYDLLNLGKTLHTIVRPLGCAIVLSGLGVLLIGIYRYFSVQNALQKGLFPTARVLTVITSGVLVAFIALNFGIFLTIPD